MIRPNCEEQKGSQHGIAPKASEAVWELGWYFECRRNWWPLMSLFWSLHKQCACLLKCNKCVSMILLYCGILFRIHISTFNHSLTLFFKHIDFCWHIFCYLIAYSLKCNTLPAKVQRWAAVTAEYLFMTLVNLSAQNFRKKQETQ